MRTFLLVATLSIAAAAWAEPLPSSNNGDARMDRAESAFERKIAWQQQQEPPTFRTFTRTFADDFNAGRMDGILQRTAPSFLAAMPGEKIAGFLGGLKSENGAIRALRFKSLDRRDPRRPTESSALYFLEFANRSRWSYRVSLDGEQRMTGLLITDSNHNEDLPLREARTALELPFDRGEQWFVLWGGETEEENYHVQSRAQKNAWDLLVRHPWSGRSFRTDGRTNADYYAFGKPVYAPATGTVVEVIDGVAENAPGTMNPKQLTGNTVVIETAPGEYVLLAHLQNGSIRVKQGDKVTERTLTGLCGNSGNSSEAHLHLQVMDKPDMREATGLKAYFRTLTIDGKSTATHYSPVRGNFIARP